MKTFKKTISFLLVFAMIITSILSAGVTVFASDASLSIFNFTEWGGIANAQISGLGISAKSKLLTGVVVIPNYVDSLEGYVTAVSDNGFQGCQYITSVSMSQYGIGTLGRNAFAGCTKMTSINLSERIFSIYGGAFNNCSSLKSITLAEELYTRAILSNTDIYGKSLGEEYEKHFLSIFSGCSSLEEIKIIDTGVTSTQNSIAEDRLSSINGVLYNYAKDTLYYYPEGKKDIAYTITTSTKYIDPYAFGDGASYNSNLQYLIFPDDYNPGNSNQFCNLLINLKMQNHVTIICKEQGIVGTYVKEYGIPYIDSSIFENFYFSGGTIYGATDLSGNVVIPNITPSGQVVDTISVFGDCENITSISIPETVTNIYSKPFAGCTNLKEINVSENNPKYCSVDGVLYNKDKTKLIYYPEGKKDATFVVPNGVSAIHTYAFYNSQNLSNVSIFDSVTEIGDYAFYKSQKLSNVFLSTKIKSIGLNAFKDCNLLSEVHYNGTETEWESVSGYPIAVDIHYDTFYAPLTDSHTAGYYCEACNKTVCEHVYHTFDSGSISLYPTHTEYGTKCYVCTVCGLTKNETVDKLTEHTYGDWIQHNDTQHKKVCECGDTIYESHSWDSGIVTTLPTHTEYGVRTYTCNLCKATKTEQINKLTGHTYGDWIPYNETHHQKVCACGSTQYAIHNWSSAVTKEATHTDEGVITFVCSDCGAEKYESIPKSGNDHLYNNYEKYTTEQHKKVCACGDYILESHNWDNGIVTRNATHTESGIKKYTCSDCGETKTVEIPIITEHTYNNYQKYNELQHKCVCACGDYILEDHSWNEGTVIKEATYYQCGTIEYICNTCGESKTEGIPKITVKETDPQVYIESKKVVKGKVFTVDVIVKNNPGFAYLELTPVYSNALTLESVTNGELISDLTKAKQLVWVSESDITFDGKLMTFTFSTSDDIEPGEYEVSFILRSCVNYDEHSVNIAIENGLIEIIDFTYGDANGDDAINGQDVVRIKKYLANYDYETETSTVEISAGADANGDGVVNGQDVVRLKKYLANYDYETETSTIVLGPQK